MTLERGDQRLELLEQRPAPRSRERPNDADEHEVAVVIVEAEQQRAYRSGVGLVCPVAGHHTVGRP